MKTIKETLELALEVLITINNAIYVNSQQEADAFYKANDAITALRVALASQGEALTSVPDWASEAIEQPAQQEPVAIKYWLQDTMESGRWVTTDNMAKATAEKMLSGEYGDVYPQGRIVEPSPPASKPWVGLTDEDIVTLFNKTLDGKPLDVNSMTNFARAIKAKIKEKNQ